MTYEEALHEISTKVYRNTDDFEMTISKDCYKKIIDALEKQIPKKPKECGEDWFVCPKCETSIVSLDELETHKFCLNCGQALDWGDTK